MTDPGNVPYRVNRDLIERNRPHVEPDPPNDYEATGALHITTERNICDGCDPRNNPMCGNCGGS